MNRCGRAQARSTASSGRARREGALTPEALRFRARRLPFMLLNGMVMALNNEDAPRSFAGRRGGPTLLRLQNLQHYGIV